jgi:light-regulated signal transduction histidine kinase (bacteriophytochrome)
MNRSVAGAAEERSARDPEERRLDAFAASAAHSLGAGVSIASGYATLLRERYADQLGDDGFTVLAGLEGGLARTRLFMDDLLQLAALDATPLEPAPVDLDSIVLAVTDGLAGMLEEGAIDVDAARLPPLVADRVMVERLFHHLVRGAIAAIGSGPGRIAISGTRDGDTVRIEVDDTGPALDQAAAGRLFETFAPPRGSGPAAGAGVGMAIARRIAERHGGSIRARTTVREAGCTIVVSLPAEGA